MNEYQIVHTKQLGLDVWLITKDGSILYSFLSEQYARARFERIRIALNFNQGRTG